ncbi:MAG TPA: hypothetical protein VFY13_08870 [Luteolibacter sp.]|nr:hypothetical protein [Luteolibacter sp.]
MVPANLWLSCPACKSARSVPYEGMQDSNLRCRACDHPISAILLPRLFATAPPPPLPGAVIPATGEAPCFYDPTQKATCLCSQCGVLVSDAWSVQWGSQKVCQRCFDKLRSNQRDSRFETSRLIWDNICLLLGLVPFTPFTYFLVIFSAPAALILGLRSWNKPGSLIPRSKFRLTLAIVFASLQVLLCVVLFYMLVSKMIRL